HPGSFRARRRIPTPDRRATPRPRYPRAVAWDASRREHGLRPRLDLDEFLSDEPFVEGGRHRRIPGARQHGRKLPALELIERPLEGIRHQGLVQVDPLVLVPGPVVVVRVDTEAVEGEQLDLLAGDVAEDVNGHATVPLAGDTHLQAEPAVARLEHV